MSITEIADTVVVVLVPGFGDSIQLMKAGLVEIADIVVVNKADYEGAENLISELRDTLRPDPNHVEPSIIKAEATNNIGVEELYFELGKRKSISSSQ
jgi:LAO/AO transport system kinase